MITTVTFAGYYLKWLLTWLAFSWIQLAELSQLRISLKFLQKYNFLKCQITVMSLYHAPCDFFYSCWISHPMKLILMLALDWPVYIINNLYDTRSGKKKVKQNFKAAITLFTDSEEAFATFQHIFLYSSCLFLTYLLYQITFDLKDARHLVVI